MRQSDSATAVNRRRRARPLPFCLLLLCFIAKNALVARVPISLYMILGNLKFYLIFSVVALLVRGSALTPIHTRNADASPRTLP